MASPIEAVDGMQRAVFVDRDGVICRNRRDHVKSWEELVFVPGSVDALVRLAQSDLRIVVITNQAIINRGIVSEKDVIDIHTRMIGRLGRAGGRIDLALYCPHRADEHCLCRKPEPRLIVTAAKQLGIALDESYLVGDAETDMVAGRTAGCGSRYLVLTGRGPWQLVRCLCRGERGFKVALNLRGAVNDILQSERRASARLR